MGLVDYIKNKVNNKKKQAVLSDITNNDAKKVRLIYVSLEKFYRYGTGEEKIGGTYDVSSVFKLPTYMSMHEAFKVISFLSDKIEKENNLEPASQKSVVMLGKILKDYGFEIINSDKEGHYHAISEPVTLKKIKTIKACEKIDGVIDLITVGGHYSMFHKSDLYERYFDWYDADVTKQEVDSIYNTIKELKEITSISK